jgi:hypothetical protein
MTPAIVVSLLAFSAPAHDGHPGPDRPDRGPDRPTEVVCPTDVVAKFDKLDDALRHLDEQLDDLHGSPRKVQHVHEDLQDVLRQSSVARVEACRAARRNDTIVVEQPLPPPPPPPSRVIVLLENEKTLASAMRKEAFDDNRLAVLSLGVRNVCVTSEQARDLVGEVTFSRPRLEALRMLAGRIVDAQDAWKLYDAFTFDSDKRAARDILTKTPQAPECAPLPPTTRL